MRIKVESVLSVISKPEFTTSKNDPNQKFYKIGIISGDEAGMLGCSEIVYGQVEAGNTYVFKGEYDAQWKSLRLTSATLKK
ncbi:MAG: hypothetical protein LBC96_04570 [Lachnospiraceae bacterium]|jgi:hypothetical protein|nr:hypothetical protein [Lachnospiraceae bacterium]